MQEQSSGYDAMQQLQLINYFYFLHFLYISHYHRLFEIIKFEERPEKGTKLSFKHL